MFDLSNPQAITTISTRSKAWHIEPGTVEVHGQVLRFVLSGTGQIMQVHVDAIETVQSEAA